MDGPFFKKFISLITPFCLVVFYMIIKPFFYNHKIISSLFIFNTNMIISINRRTLKETMNSFFCYYYIRCTWYICWPSFWSRSGKSRLMKGLDLLKTSTVEYTQKVGTLSKTIRDAIYLPIYFLMLILCIYNVHQLYSLS